MFINLLYELSWCLLTVSESVPGSSGPDTEEKDCLSRWWPGNCLAPGGGPGPAVMLGATPTSCTSTGSSLMSGRAVAGPGPASRLLSSSSLRSELVDTVGRGSSTEVSLLGSFSYSFTAICCKIIHNDVDRKTF